MTISNLTRRTVTAGLTSFPLFASAQEVSFKAKKGIALYPWFHQTRERKAPSTGYDFPPFNPLRPVPNARDLAQLKQAGFDHVRLPFDPGPFLAGELAQQNALMNELDKAVRLCLQQGLKVILNLHPNESTHYWTSRRLMAGLGNENFENTLLLLSRLAKTFNKISPALLAFEPMNEPKFAPASREWEVLQAELHKAIRKEAPLHTIILTGAEGSLIHGLTPFNPRSVNDQNVWFTFHFYEPFRFTHQSGSWTGHPTRLLGGLEWEATTQARDKAYELTARNIFRVTSNEKEQARLFKEVKGAIDAYYDKKETAQMIKDHLGVVVKWCKQHSIPQEKLYLGEFGVVKTTESRFGASVDSRAKWVKDVRLTAEAYGFGWCFWNYFDVMGLVIDDKTRQLDPSLLVALGLNNTK